MFSYEIYNNLKFHLHTFVAALPQYYNKERERISLGMNWIFQPGMNATIEFVMKEDKPFAQTLK